MKRKLIAAIGVAGMMIGVAACGCDDGGSDSTAKSGADGFKGQTLTVWAMDGSTPAQWTEGRHRRLREEDAARSSSSRSSSGTASSRS